MCAAVSGLESAREKLLNPICSFFDILMFPNMNNCPTHFRQKSVITPISLLVLINFILPKTCICLWLYSMNGTAMPEAAINKDHHSGPHEYYVRSSRQVLAVDSISQTASVQNGAQAKLGFSIAGAQIAHELPYNFT